MAINCKCYATWNLHNDLSAIWANRVFCADFKYKFTWVGIVILGLRRAAWATLPLIVHCCKFFPSIVSCQGGGKRSANHWARLDQGQCLPSNTAYAFSCSDISYILIPIADDKRILIGSRVANGKCNFNNCVYCGINWAGPFFITNTHCYL